MRRRIPICVNALGSSSLDYCIQLQSLRELDAGDVGRYSDSVVTDMAKRRSIERALRKADKPLCAEEALQTSQARLRALSRRIESVREETQSQIAREIHDSIGQSVSGIAMSLGWIARRLSPTVDREVSRELKDMETVLSGLTTKVQEMTMRLRPQILDDLGLKEAITAEVQGFAERTNIQCTVRVSLPPHALDDAGNTAVFRICQEALTNVYRHAKATAVHIVLYEQGGRILFAVSDNGRGITDEQVRAPKSLGILGMQERALALGGKIDFTGQPGSGTTVTLSLPIARKSGNRRRKPS
jgi:signal transduction histidine kinase